MMSYAPREDTVIVEPIDTAIPAGKFMLTIFGAAPGHENPFGKNIYKIRMPRLSQVEKALAFYSAESGHT